MVFRDLAQFAATRKHAAKRAAFPFMALDCRGLPSADPVEEYRHLVPFRVLRLGCARSGVDAATGDVLVEGDFVSSLAAAGPAGRMPLH